MTTKDLSAESPLRLMSPDEAAAIAKDVLSRVTVPIAVVSVGQDMVSTTQLSRNRVRNVESSSSLKIDLTVAVNNREANVVTTRTDAEGLNELVQEAESAAKQSDPNPKLMQPLRQPREVVDAKVYFDSSIAAGASEMQVDLIRSTTVPAQAKGLVAAGDMVASSSFLLVMNTAGFNAHVRNTYAEFSMTARTKDGTGSGWAWSGREDFSRIDPATIAEQAISLCEQSDHPVAVEPGRYTVILEPEAVARLIESVTGPETYFMNGFMADHGSTVYSKKEGGNKLGLKMADERVQILYDPYDAEMPFNPLSPYGSVYSRTMWHENGVLKNLAFESPLTEKYHIDPVESPWQNVAKLEVSGATQSLEEMIASTKRGIWVHRLSGVSVINRKTLLTTGVTRDGTFLIENGKISKSIKNLRFSESPFFILNKIEAFGPSVRASISRAAPRLKVHDFEFTSLSDAV